MLITQRPFAPVAKMDSIRLVLAIAASKGWQVHHMDVKSTFLHGEIQEYIYMSHLQFPNGIRKNTSCRGSSWKTPRS